MIINFRIVGSPEQSASTKHSGQHGEGLGRKLNVKIFITEKKKYIYNALRDI